MQSDDGDIKLFVISNLLISISNCLLIFYSFLEVALLGPICTWSFKLFSATTSLPSIFEKVGEG